MKNLKMIKVIMISVFYHIIEDMNDSNFASLVYNNNGCNNRSKQKILNN